MIRGGYLSISIIAGAAGLTGCGEELATKPEWSILQGLEAEYRAKPVPELTVMVRSNHYFVSLQGCNIDHVWVMLDAKESPLYKQMPPGNYQLTAAALDTITRTDHCNSTVIECLRSHLRCQ